MGSRVQTVSRRSALSRRSIALAAGAVAALALLPATAAAQFPMPGVHLGGDKEPPSKEELERRRALDKAYKSATEKIPEKKPAADPWGNLRAAPGGNASGTETGKQ
jgi:hypothetical protein